MKKVTLLISLLFALVFISPVSANAQLMINELSSWSTTDDWVELYNFGEDQVDLSGYIIRDSTETNKITLSGFLEKNSFATFGFSNRLNRSKDTVKLLNTNDSAETLVDSIYYGGNDQVCSPDEGETIGRVTDGGNTIDRFRSGTKNTSNNNSQLAPCPAPSIPQTPTDKPMPTLVPSVTNTPSPVEETKAPSPPDDNRQTPSLKDVVETVSSDSSDLILGDTSTISGEAQEENILISEEITDRNNLVKGMKTKFIPATIFFTGMIFIGYAFYSIIKSVKKGYNFKHEGKRR